MLFRVQCIIVEIKQGLRTKKISQRDNLQNYRIQITEIQNSNHRNTELQNYRNTNYKIAEIQITGLQKYKLNKSSPIIQKLPTIDLLNLNYG